MTSLTPRQAECLAAIERLAAEHGHGPSLDEIAAALGMRARGAVHPLLVSLRDRGHITWTPRLSRSITVLRQDRIRLSPAIRERLAAHCAATGDRPDDVIADAVALHLDHVEPDERDYAHG